MAVDARSRRRRSDTPSEPLGRNRPLHERFTCTPVCRIIAALLWPASVIGPAGDALLLPLQIVGGRVSGVGAEKRITYGADFATMRADEKLLHKGACVFADPRGDVLVSFDGMSQGEEGAYDDILEGRFTSRIPSRLAVRVTSTNPEWRRLNEWPLFGVGWFDAGAGTLDVTLISIDARGAEASLVSA